VKFLAKQVSGTGLQDAVSLPVSRERETILAQATFAATGTVEIQGRLHADFGWEVIATISDTDTDHAVRLSPFPLMRANITASTGAITVGVND